MKSLRDLLPDYVTNPDNLVTGSDPPLEHQKTAAEAKVAAQLPGDDPQQHPLSRPPNPYLGRSRSELRRRLFDPKLTPDVERLIRAALTTQQLQHSDGPCGRPDQVG